MEKLFSVEIISPEKIIYRADIQSLVVPSELGYLGILADHAALIAHLAEGKIILKDGAGEERVFHSGSQGFLEVLENKVTIVLDAAGNLPQNQN